MFRSRRWHPSKYRASLGDCQPSLQFANIQDMAADVHAQDHVGGDGERSWPSGGLGPALRRAWLGYQRRLDVAMAEAGFDQRRFPDGRVLRMCAGQTGSTISAIGRELGITRQGAGKVVGQLRDRGFVLVADSVTSKREKAVTLTPRGVDYLRAQRAAAREIDDELRAALGESGFLSLRALLEELDDHDTTRLRTYLRGSVRG